MAQNLPVEKILKLAEKQADSAEVFSSSTRSVSCFVDSDRENMAIVNNESGFGLRVFANRKVGFAFSSDFSKTSAEKTVRRALLASSHNRENKSFEFPAKSKKGRGEWDSEIASADAEKVVADLGYFRKQVLSEKNVQIPLTSLKYSAVKYRIVNSSGLDVSGRGTFAAIEPYVIAKKPGRREEVINRKQFRHCSKKDLDLLADETVRLAKEALSAKQLKTGEYEVIFHPAESAALFNETFGVVWSQKTQLDGISIHRPGHKIMDERISVADEIDAKNGPASFETDQEGIFRKPLPLVENGVFKQFFSDSFYASLAGKEPTGNGRRMSNDFENWYASPVGPALNNFVFQAGDCSLQELIEDTKKGLFVLRTAYPLADAVSGSFTNEVRSGFFVEGGEIKHSVKQSVVNGSVYELFRDKLASFSKEREPVVCSSSSFETGGFVPFFKFRNVTVAGG